MQLKRARGLTFVHPYDDPDVIAGQGTIGMEILRQHPKPIDAVFVPVGGGGLISGIAAYIKTISPGDPHRRRRAGRRGRDDAVAEGGQARSGSITSGLFADGVAVKQVGKETFRLCRQLVDEMVLVDTDAMCAAIKDVFEDTRVVLEPAGALAIAGAKAWVERHGVRGQDPGRDRVGREHQLRPAALHRRGGGARRAARGGARGDDPGAPGQLPQVLRDARRHATSPSSTTASPTRRRRTSSSASRCDGRDETARIVGDLRSNGLKTHRPLRQRDGEVARPAHGRRRAPLARNELLYRFEFPERPGALMKFLDSMSSDWNISLFHYRNHGADYGRVLVGMQVPREEMRQFRAFLQKLGYPYADETRNPAYRLFLG